MSRRVLSVLCLPCLLVVGLLCWLVWPISDARLGMLDPRIAAIREPCRSVDVYLYLDGAEGCGFRFIGEDGSEQLVSVVNRRGRQRMFLGNLSKPEQGEEIVPLQDNVVRLTEILRNTPGSDWHRDIAISFLSKRMDDRIKVKIRKLVKGDNY